MAIDKRKIPKSDKAKRSLYMSPTYMKNLKVEIRESNGKVKKQNLAQEMITPFLSLKKERLEEQVNTLLGHHMGMT